MIARLATSPLGLRLLDWRARQTKAWIARTDDELRAVARLRYDVYVTEQGDHREDLDEDTRTLGLTSDRAETATVFAIGPRDRPLATVRTDVYEPGRIPAEVFDSHDLNRFPTIESRRIVYVTRLIARPELRGDARVLGMTIGAIDQVSRATPPDLMVVHSLPGLMSRYRALGLRPYGAAALNTGRGLEIPMAMTPDPTRLRATGAAWWPCFDRLAREGVLRTTGLEPLEEPFADPGVWIGPPEIVAQLGGRRPDAVADMPPATWAALLGVALLHDVAPGDQLAKQGFACRDPMVLLDGTVDVEIDGVRVATLGAGAVFGERTFFEEGGRRMASVRARSAGRILHLRASGVRRLCDRDPRHAAAIHRLLARTCAQPYHNRLGAAS